MTILASDIIGTSGGGGVDNTITLPTTTKTALDFNVGDEAVFVGRSGIVLPTKHVENCISLQQTGYSNDGNAPDTMAFVLGEDNRFLISIKADYRSASTSHFPRIAVLDRYTGEQKNYTPTWSFSASGSHSRIQFGRSFPKDGKTTAILIGTITGKFVQVGIFNAPDDDIDNIVMNGSSLSSSWTNSSTLGVNGTIPNTISEYANCMWLPDGKCFFLADQTAATTSYRVLSADGTTADGSGILSMTTSNGGESNCDMYLTQNGNILYPDNDTHIRVLVRTGDTFALGATSGAHTYNTAGFPRAFVDAPDGGLWLIVAYSDDLRMSTITLASDDSTISATNYAQLSNIDGSTSQRRMMKFADGTMLITSGGHTATVSSSYLDFDPATNTYWGTTAANYPDYINKNNLGATYGFGGYEHMSFDELYVADCFGQRATNVTAKGLAGCALMDNYMQLLGSELPRYQNAKIGTVTAINGTNITVDVSGYGVLIKVATHSRKVGSIIVDNKNFVINDDYFFKLDKRATPPRISEHLITSNVATNLTSITANDDLSTPNGHVFFSNDNLADMAVSHSGSLGMFTSATSNGTLNGHVAVDGLILYEPSGFMQTSSARYWDAQAQFTTTYRIGVDGSGAYHLIFNEEGDLYNAY